MPSDNEGHSNNAPGSTTLASCISSETSFWFQLFGDSLADYAVLLIDAEGRIIRWSRGAERVIGYAAAEITGKHFSVFYLREDIASGKPAMLLRNARQHGRIEDESWRVRKDGSRFWVNSVITAIRDAEGSLEGFAIITRDMTEPRRREEALRKLTGRLLSLQDEERRRIARELHDGAAQTLAALSMDLARLRARPAMKSDSGALRTAAESETLARQASDEIRNISHLLHPPDLDRIGIAAAIRWYVRRFSERTGISVELNLPAHLPRFGRDLETASFRVIQESLANIQRHSGSKTAEVRLMLKDRQLTLEIQDQGCGMPAAMLGDDSEDVLQLGIGVTGMKERMRQLGGDMAFVSTPGGTTVRATAPLPAVGAASARASS